MPLRFISAWMEDDEVIRYKRKILASITYFDYCMGFRVLCDLLVPFVE